MKKLGQARLALKSKKGRGWGWGGCWNKTFRTRWWNAFFLFFSVPENRGTTRLCPLFYPEQSEHFSDFFFFKKRRFNSFLQRHRYRCWVNSCEWQGVIRKRRWLDGWLLRLMVRINLEETLNNEDKIKVQNTSLSPLKVVHLDAIFYSVSTFILPIFIWHFSYLLFFICKLNEV